MSSSRGTCERKLSRDEGLASNGVAVEQGQIGVAPHVVSAPLREELPGTYGPLGGGGAGLFRESSPAEASVQPRAPSRQLDSLGDFRRGASERRPLVLGSCWTQVSETAQRRGAHLAGVTNPVPCAVSQTDQGPEALRFPGLAACYLSEEVPHLPVRRLPPNWSS